MEKVENYLKLNDKYLKEGDALLEKGDYVQASEKFWGAAAEVIKAIAVKREIDVRSHGEMYRFITTLSKETKDTELVNGVQVVGGSNRLTPTIDLYLISSLS